MAWYLLCKLVFPKCGVVAAYAGAGAVCYYKVRYFKYQVVAEGLLQYRIAQLYMWGLAFNNNLRVEVLVKDNNVASETFVSKLYCVFACHKLQRIVLLFVQPLDEMLSYLLLRGKGHVLFA